MLNNDGQPEEWQNVILEIEKHHKHFNKYFVFLREKRNAALSENGF